MTESQPRHVLHRPEPRHLVQVDEVLVAEVDFRVLNVLGLFQRLPDDFRRHGESLLSQMVKMFQSFWF